METPGLIFCVALPLAGAALVVVLGRWPNLREAASLATAGWLLLEVLALLPAVEAGERPEAVLVAVIPEIPLAFEVEPLGMMFALVASFLWIVTTIYSIGYMRGHRESNQTRFYACFAIAIASAIGVAFAANLLTLFVFYEALTLSTYPLVTHSGTDEARRAGRVYLGILLGTSIAFQLFAILWVWVLTGTTDFQAGGILHGYAGPVVTGVLLALFVFGIGKAAVMPFHRWLPAAMVAPTPVSALLHAVAVVKAGVFAVLKVVVYIFGAGHLAAVGGGADWLLAVAALTVIAGSLIALNRDNLKARLAYSTVSQLSYIVMGALLASAWGIVGAGLHIVMHAFAKITLFFCAGAVLVAHHRTEVSELDGIGRMMPFTMGAFLIASLSIVGLPLFGGMWSKWYLALGTIEAGHYAVLAVLMLSSLLSVAYLLPIPVRAFAKRDPEATARAGAGGGNGIQEAPWPCVLAIGITAAGCLGLFWYAERWLRLMEQLVQP